MLFNTALNTFYIWLYHVEHMVTDHLDSKRRNPLPPLHGILFPSSFTRQDSTYHASATPVMEGRKEMFYLTTHQHILFTVIWHQTYGKGPFR